MKLNDEFKAFVDEFDFAVKSDVFEDIETSPIEIKMNMLKEMCIDMRDDLQVEMCGITDPDELESISKSILHYNKVISFIDNQLSNK